VKVPIIVSLLALIAGFAEETAAAGPVEVSADASVMSSYVWRGRVLTDDPVLQPSLTAGFMGVSLNIWGNMDLTEYKDRRYSPSEIDYTLTCSLNLPLVEVSVGAVVYTYPGVSGEDPTTELILGLESSLPGNPSLTVFQDVDKAEGTYILAGASQTVPLGALPGIDVSFSLGWGSAMHNRYIYDIAGMHGAFTDAAVTVGLPLKLSETLSAAPTVSSVFRLKSEMRKAFHKGRVVFGLTALAGF
jgi:hypothetical protein